MIIYNPHNEGVIKERIKEAEDILSQISVKHCFITGSFLFKKNYRDIDIFVISRTKTKIKVNNKKARVVVMDFNDLYSLFYHSISKSCIAKDILPMKPLKVTVSDYWQVINEAVPVLMNQKNKFHKNIRFLILYTEYFRIGEVLDSVQLDKAISAFKNYGKILNYIKKEIPKIIKKNMTESYARRFFYTQAGFYKDIKEEYDAQNILYELTHTIVRGVTAHG